MAWREDEPVRGGYPDASLLALSGLDRMQAIFHQQMPPPPIHHLFGLTPVEATTDGSLFSMPCSPWLQTDAGVFFAGTAALVADAPLGSAVGIRLGPGQVAVTSDLSLNFLRPVDVRSESLIARARPIEVGHRLGLAEARIEDGHGRLVAHGTTRCFVTSFGVPDQSDVPKVEAVRYETPDPYERPLPDGLVAPERWDTMDFMEIAGKQMAGEIPPPPFAGLFKSELVKVEPGSCTLRFPANPWFTSPAGTVYGGVIAFLADNALTGAMSSTLEKKEIAASLDLKVQFLRPVFPDGRDLQVDARVVHRGRSFATAQAEMTNADGKPVALATSSAIIRSGRTWGSLVVADEAAETDPA